MIRTGCPDPDRPRRSGKTVSSIAIPAVLLWLLDVAAAGTDPIVGALPDFSGYEGKPTPKVADHGQRSVFHPCSQCHEHWETNKTPRRLAPVHDVGLKHGQGRLWCLVCHDAQDRNTLHTLRGSKIDFNEAWRVCGQCHSARQKDWYYGAHGKRERGWKGEAVRYDCTSCHNPHQPPFERRRAKPPPLVRAGLKPMKDHQRHDAAPWERPLIKKAGVDP